MLRWKQIEAKWQKLDTQTYEVLNKPFFSYRYSKYHRPTSFGFELDVQTLRNISRPLKTSCHPYIARGNVYLINPMSLSCPSAENVWFGPCMH